MFEGIRNPEVLGPDAETAYFLDSHRRRDAKGRPVSLVVEHATGIPKFAVVAGIAVPYAEWRRSAATPRTGETKGITLQSADGALSLGITVGQ